MLIGISVANLRRMAPIVRAVLGAGVSGSDIFQISTTAHAAHVRDQGGLVIHVEGLRRPSMPDHHTSAGVECALGDYVVCAGERDDEDIGAVLAVLSEIQADG